MGRRGLGAAPKGRMREDVAAYAQLKVRVQARAGSRCEACTATLGPFEFHHVIERSQGGPDLAWNLLHLCRHCHRAVEAPFVLGRLVTELVRITESLDWEAVVAMADLPPFGMETVEDGRLHCFTWWVPPDGVRLSYHVGPDKWTVQTKTLIRVIRFDDPG
jgi:HNH endonuclease